MSAISQQKGNKAKESPFLDIEIPFDWDKDDGLEAAIDGAYNPFPANSAGVDLRNTFIPLPGFSKYSDQENQNERSKRKRKLKIFVFFLLASILFLGPYFIILYFSHLVFVRHWYIFALYRRYMFFAFFFEFCMVLYIILWELVNFCIQEAYRATHEHYFKKTAKKSDENVFKFKYSVIFTLLKPQTFEVIVMSKNAIFFCVFFLFISFWYKIYYFYLQSTHLWTGTFFSAFLNKTLNELLLISAVVTLQRIVFAMIVSDFYYTVYSDRMMDLCFAIQALQRLLRHVENANEDSHFCHKFCSQPSEPDLGRRIFRKSFKFFSGWHKPLHSHHYQYPHEGGPDEMMEPIISSYQQFRQLLLNSSQFAGIIDNRAVAKQTAKTIYEHFYFPSKDSQDRAALPSVPFDAEIKRKNFSHIFSMEDEEKLFQILDLNTNSITPHEFKTALTRLALEKETLAKNLLDHGMAVKKLDSLFFFFTFTVILIFTPVVIGLPVKELFATVGGLFSLSFIFGNSSAVLFNSLLFMFITHPFDVGDRVFLLSDTYFVHEIGIYYTVLQTIDGLMVYVPNSILIDQQIVNIKRSRNMVEWIDLTVDYSTPVNKLKLLAQKVRSIIETECKDFEYDELQVDLAHQEEVDGRSKSSLIKCVELIGLRNFRIGITLPHQYNFQDGFSRAARHFKFMKALIDALKELSIVYYPTRLKIRYSPEQFLLQKHHE